MGSREKAKELLEASQAHQHYSTIVEYALTYFIAQAEKEGSPIAEELKRIRERYRDQFDKALEVTVEVYAEIFSDQEMDELKVLQTNPAMEKLRGLTSEIFNRVLERQKLAAG